MMFLNVLDANDQLLEAELDGFAYHLGLSWNEAGQLWALSVRDLDRQLLVSGIRVVPLYPLLQQVRRPELPPGEIVVDCARWIRAEAGQLRARRRRFVVCGH